MDDSSSDESFYITQSSTRSESSRRDIDDCSFETATLLDTENTRHRVTETNKEIQNVVAVATSDLFEGKSGFRRIIYLDVLFLAK